MIHRCTACGMRYESTFPRRGLCTYCWALDNGYTNGKVVSGLISQMGLLVEDYVRLQELAKPTKPEIQNGLSQDQIRKLIGLCHPDRHGNSKTATEITQWLLSQRNKSGG